MEPSNYKDYRVQDFVRDDLFVKWVLKPDKESGHFWYKWMQNNPEKKPILEAARKFVEHLHYKDHFEIDNAQYTHILEQVMRYKWQQDISEQNEWRTKIRTIWWSLAASVVIIAATVATANYFSSKAESAAIKTSYIIKEVPKGAKYSFSLPDGSKVQVNAGSQIKYPESFGENERNVYLTGEAFFNVEKDEERPFIVHTGALLTTVLGTSFNIRAYPDEPLKKIAVVSGVVKVSSAQGAAIFVEPKKMAVYKGEDQTLNNKLYNINKEIGWKDGLLYFHKATLAQVFKELESWYGVEITHTKDISENDQYSGEYRNETLENVLEGISYTSGFQFNIEGKRVTIFKLKHDI